MAAPHRIVINIRDAVGEKESGEARQTIVCWLVALATLMVLFGGLFPFDFVSPTGSIIGAIHDRFDFSLHDLWISESAKKLIFYIPLGFALGSLVWVWPLREMKQAILRGAIAVAIAGGLATIAEVSQVFLTRDPSLADIVSKTIGGAIGVGGFILFGEPVVQFLVRQLLAIRRIKNPRVFAIAGGFWLLLTIVAPISARNCGTLASWQPAYPILLGNEPDGIHFWIGNISNVWLSAAAIGEDEIESLMASKDPSHALQGSLAAAYHLTGDGPYADKTLQSGDLIWTANPREGALRGTTEPADLTGLPAIGSFGVPLSSAWSLRTADGGAAKALNRISQSQAFTLMLDLAAHDLDHGEGWPRIFAISRGVGACNLELLQDHQNLQLHLRSGATGDGGTDPEFVVPGIFTDTLPQRLIVSYDHGKILVECAKGGRYSLRYSPDAWLIWRLFPGSFWHYTMGSPGQSAAIGIYRIVAMFPVGVLLAAMLRLIRNRGDARRLPLVFISTVCVSALLLETMLCYFAGTSFSSGAMIISLLAAVAGTFAILGYVPIRQRWV